MARKDESAVRCFIAGGEVISTACNDLRIRIILCIEEIERFILRIVDEVDGICFIFTGTEGYYRSFEVRNGTHGVITTSADHIDLRRQVTSAPCFSIPSAIIAGGEVFALEDN